MNELSIDLKEVLADTRMQAVAAAEGGWPELGRLMDSILPDPLNSFALLPVATGRAVGGKISKLTHIAAVVTLIDVSLRIVDDCADQDRTNALYLSVGIGPAMNYAMALNAVAGRELLGARFPAGGLGWLNGYYFSSFLEVCRGQDYDLNQRVATLEEYQEIVRLKTIAAYRFAAGVGAQVASSDISSITLCSKCGEHLGWMAQILDDIEALWFPLTVNIREVEKKTFPVLLGMTIDHPNAKRLDQLFDAEAYDRNQVCELLDEMGVRTRLVNAALDHRDAALKTLNEPHNPEGKRILKLWLDWYLRDGARLLQHEGQAQV